VPTVVGTHAAPDGPVRTYRSGSVSSPGAHRLVELPDGQTVSVGESAGGRWRGTRWRGNAELQQVVADSPSALIAELTGRRSADESWIREVEVWLLVEAELGSLRDPDLDSVRRALPGIIDAARLQADANAAAAG